MSRRTRRGPGFVAFLAAIMVGSPLRAQERPVEGGPPPVPAAPSADTVAADTADGLPSPSGAFVRSLLVPGWGQAEFGAYLRGGVYFAVYTGSAFMVFKTLVKLGEARGVEARRVAATRDSLLALAAMDPARAARYEDPAELEADIAQDSLVAHKRRLIRAREEQREDWIAWLIFWTLIDGVDAYVTAQLADFPADIIAEPVAGGGARVGLRLRLRGIP